MISKMREIAPIFIVIALVAFLATIFFSWGMDITGMGSRPVAGSIEGKRIALDAFDRMVNMERQRLQQSQQGGEVPPEEYRKVPQEVWDRMVQEELMSKVFTAMRLGASADETFEYLRRNPPPGVDTMQQFQTNGVYDTTKWEQLLNNPAIYDQPGWRETELHTRHFIIPTGKLETLLRMGTVPSKLEVTEAYRQRTQKAVIEYAYVASRPDLVGSSQVTDDMIHRYYTEHPDTFKAPEQVEMYYVALPKVPTANDEATLRKDLADVKERVQSGQGTFADEAEAGSDDEGTAQKGGDLGWFGKGAMVPEFEQAAFAAKVGEVVGPIRSTFGYHLLVVEEKRVQNGKEQVHARHILRKIQPSLETLDSLKNILDSVASVAREEGLKKAGEKAGLRVDSTGLVPKGLSIPSLGFVSGVGAFISNGTVGEVSENVLENPHGFYVFEIKRKLRAGVTPLPDVRSRIAKVLGDSVAEQAARTRLSDALAKLPAGSSLVQLKSIDSAIQAGVTDSVSQMAYVPPLGFGTEAVAAAFAGDTGKVSGIVAAQGGVCVVRPLHRSHVEAAAYGSSAMDFVKQSVMSTAAQHAYVDWYVGAKQGANVKCQLDKFYLE